MKNKILIIITSILLIITVKVYAGYYEQGCSYYVYKKYDKAKEMFLKAAETSDYGNAYYFIGEIEKNNGNYEESEKYFRIATTKKSTSRKYLKNAYWNMLVLAEQKGDYNNVIKICKEMWIKLKDESAKQKIESLINKYLWTDNKEAIEMYKNGIEYKQNNETAKAVNQFKQAINADYNFLAPKFELGIIAYNKENLDEALNYLSEVASKINFYAEAHLILGDIYYKKQYYQRAIEHFDKVFEYGFISKDTEYIIRIKRGTCYYNINDYDNANDDIEKAVQFSKKSIEPMLLLSAIQIKRKEYDDALKTLHGANQQSPNNPVILYQIGSIYYKQDNPRYLSYFDKLFDILENKKKYSEKYNSVFIILIKDHFKNKNYKRVSQIISNLPKNLMTSDINSIAAKTYYYLNDNENAIKYLEKASSSNDDKFVLCQAYAKKGEHEKAKNIISNLLYDDNFIRMVKKDKALSPILNEIEKEKKKKQEEEARRAEQEKKALEEKLIKEKKKSESDSLDKPSTDNKNNDTENIESGVN